MCFTRSHPNPARAFTLIELLVVIGIIAILASILLPVLGTAHAQSDAAKCVSNMRNLGTAITSYGGEHDGHLPGPVEPLVYPGYTTNGEKDTALVKFIAPYISVDSTVNTTSVTTRETVTTCPAFVRTVKVKGLPCYVLNFADKIPNVGVPWMDVGSGLAAQMTALTAWTDTRATSSTYTQSPTGQKDLTRTWALKDVDLQAFANMAGVGDTSNLPDKPVHGDYRNALFYDWHVGRLDLNDNPK